VLTDYVFKAEQDIHLSLAMVPGVLGTTCFALLLLGLPAYRSCAREAESWHGG